MSNPSIYGKLTDTYTSTTKPSSLIVGQVYEDNNTGKKYQFLLNGGATLAANKAFKRDPAASGQVIATAAATDGFAGVNSTGASITAANYFWGQIAGDCTPLVAAAVSAGAILAPSGTSGTLDAGSAAAVQQLRCVLLADSGAGGATAACLY